MEKIGHVKHLFAMSNSWPISFGKDSFGSSINTFLFCKWTLSKMQRKSVKSSVSAPRVSFGFYITLYGTLVIQYLQTYATIIYLLNL